MHVVFGEVVSGQEVVSHIEGLPVDRMSRPLQDAKVVNCGELVLKLKTRVKKREAKDSSSSASESDSYAGKSKKSKKNKKNKKRSKSEEGEIRDSEEEEHGQPHPLVSVTKIDPDEIPEVPANKFLYRAGSTNNANQKEFRQHYGRERMRSHRKTGRIFKGRGIFRYHASSRSRSRSITPPHWKQAQNRTIKLHEFQKLEKERMKKEEEIKKHEADRKKKFGECDNKVDFDNKDIEELMNSNANRKLDEAIYEGNKPLEEAKDVSQVTQNQDHENTNVENNGINANKLLQDKANSRRRDEKSEKRINRPYVDRFSRRDSRERGRRRSGRSRSRDRRRSKDRNYDRKSSRDRKSRRYNSPIRRRDSHRSNKSSRESHKHYEKRNDDKQDKKPNNPESQQETEVDVARDKTKEEKMESVSDSLAQPKFKRRSRSSSSSSQRSKN